MMHWKRNSAAVGVVSAGMILAGGLSFFIWKGDASKVLPIVPFYVAAAVSADGAHILDELNRQIASERSRIHLSVVDTADVWASGEALRGGKVDAAVVRNDDPGAGEARTVFVLNRVVVALLAPAQASADDMGKLKGKKIGIVVEAAGLDPMAKAVIDFYGFDEKHVLRLAGNDVADSLRHKQIAGLLVVGPVGAGPIEDAIEAFRKVTKRPPKFVDISEAKAIGSRFALYSEDEISAGAFGPALPSDNVTTISSSLLLAARPSLSNDAAGELTRMLLATKARLAATVPAAAQMAAPSTDKDVLRPAHAGTIAFLNGEQPDLLDRSTNVFLLGSMLTGCLGSLATFLNGLRNRKKGNELKRRMHRLATVLAQTSILDRNHIHAAEKEVAQLSQWLAQKFMMNEISAKDFHAAEASIARIATLIRKKRTSASLDQLERIFRQWRHSPAHARA
jgi:TRAP-type uncharacterized transport system substrate-binding protein